MSSSSSLEQDEVVSVVTAKANNAMTKAVRRSHVFFELIVFIIVFGFNIVV